MLRETGAGMSVRNPPRLCKRCSPRAHSHVFLTARHHRLETSLHRLPTGGGTVSNRVQPSTSRRDSSRRSHTWAYPEEAIRNYARNYAEAAARLTGGHNDCPKSATSQCIR
jgi:hypothetical protein